MTKTAHDNQVLIDYWDRAFMSESQQSQIRSQETVSWKKLAPSEKLYRAAASLGSRKMVLDLGCGSAWAGNIAAKKGCADITAADAAPGAVRAARLYTALYGVEKQVHPVCIAMDWLQKSLCRHL